MERERPLGSAGRESAAATAGGHAETERTLELLVRARGGDRDALDALCRRHLPRLTRWARGRLPRRARSLHETDDLVQDALVAALSRLGDFEPRHDGALQAYLRQAVLNKIKNDLRGAQRHPAGVSMEDVHADPGPSPFEEAVGVSTLERYERALAALDDDARALVLLRVEQQQDYAAIAAATGRRSADAARMAVGRALVRLAEAMGDGR